MSGLRVRSWWRIFTVAPVLAAGIGGVGSSGPASAAGPTHAISIALTGANGVGTITTPGLSCADGGQGNYRRLSIDGGLAGGAFSSLASHLRGTFDVHHDGVEPPVGPVVPAPPAPSAFLLGTESHVTFSNARGAMQLRLSSGACPARATTGAGPGATLSFDGTTFATTGSANTWTIDPTSPSSFGAYRQASGSGTFTMTAGDGPGADNPWSVNLVGNVSILEPSMSLTVVGTNWGNLGLDYALRTVSVTYQVTNSGPGDAFNTSVTSATSPTDDVTGLGPMPQTIGDLAAGQSATFTVRYQLGLLSPCTLVILNCNFATTVTMSMPDALDTVLTPSAGASVTAPALPPPL